MHKYSSGKKLTYDKLFSSITMFYINPEYEAQIEKEVQEKTNGLGNHDPGKGRHSGKMPLWNCLHPGRAWAERLQPYAFTAEELEQRVQEYLNDDLL